MKKASELGILPLQNFIVIYKELKSTGDVNEGINAVFHGQQDEKSFVPEFEHLDIKRDYLMNNFFYLSLRLAFEGFEEDMKDFEKDLISSL